MLDALVGALAPYLDYPGGSCNRFNDLARPPHLQGSNLEDMSGVEDTPAVPKAEHSREPSSSSVASTPEPDAEIFAQENAQVQKRKGGRKPVGACSIRIDSLIHPSIHPSTHFSPTGSWGGGPTLTWTADLRHFRGEKAAEPPGSSRLPRTTNRVHQAARDDHQASRGHLADLAAEPSQCGGRMPHAAVQELVAGKDSARKRSVGPLANLVDLTRQMELVD